MNRLFSTLANKSSNTVEIKKRLLPKLAVFDLDHTVWPFGIDGFPFIPPFYFYQGKLIDTNSKEIKHFSDFPKIFEHLKSNNIEIALASRTKYPTGAYRLIELFDWNKFINYYQIYPGKKIKHFERIREESGIDFKEMIFFDDEQRNIIDVSQLGVYAVLVPNETGATQSIVNESLEKFVEKEDSN